MNVRTQAEHCIRRCAPLRTMTERMIVDNIFALGALAGQGQQTLANPLSDLHSAQRAGTNYNGHMGAPAPRVRMGGGVGGLVRRSDQPQKAPFDVLGRMDPPMFSNEPKVNVPHPVTRLSKPLAPDIPSVSRDELVFYKQDDPRNNRCVMKVDGAMLQYNPLSYVNPAQWNLISLGEQKQMWDRSQTEYKQSTPKEWFAGWRLEGIVEQNGQGVGSSLFTKSIRNNQPLCILTKGHTTTNSYWPYAQPGDDLYVVLKKMAYNPNFCLNTRENNSSSGAGQRPLPSDHLPFRPVQMGFYSSRRGAVLPCEVYEYEDDDGCTRSDAHVICVGTLHFLAGGVAQFDSSHRLDDNNMECELHAYVDSNEGVSRNNYTPQKMILDHCNGIWPF
jgi:hypothetical protein